MSDSSTPTTPMILTPDSTGGGPPEAQSVAIKKARRQTAFYPNMNANKALKPFSRSAAKRESVMALGSIEHLQHYFTKTGIAAKKNPFDKPHYGLVRAIGGPSHVPSQPSLSSLQEFNLPPSPAVPEITRPAHPPFVKTYEIDPENLLPGVVDDLSAVSHAWGFDEHQNLPSSDLASNDPHKMAIDILDVLKTTTHAIRAIRNYLLSLPNESAGTIRAQYRSKILGPEKIQTSSLASSSSSSPPDPLTLIRRSALEVLTVLRELEESSRLPLSDEAYDAQSEGGNSRGGGSHSRFTSPYNPSQDLPLDESNEAGLARDVDPDASLNFSLVQVPGRYESVPVWEDEEGTSEEETIEKREHWDDKLILSSGWLYRQDVYLEDLQKEQKVIGLYLDVVDDVLFGGRKEHRRERGWERERQRREVKAVHKLNRRRVSAGDGDGRGIGLHFDGAVDGGKRRISTGMVNMMRDVNLSEEPEEMEDIQEVDESEDSIDDEDLPEWAGRNTFIGDELGRARAVLSVFLPPDLLLSLSPSSPRDAFLACLSSGQLLCVAYNNGVRKSKKPWGYVSKDSIHDILALEQAVGNDEDNERGRKGWTFRRTDNLRIWAGALKLRYMLPIQIPSQVLSQVSGPVSGSPMSQRFPKTSSEPPILFDAKVVARKDQGWEDMLERLLLKWIQKVVDERRSQR